MVHPSTPDPDTQPQPTCAICGRRIRIGMAGLPLHIEHADHVAVGPGRATSIVVDLSGVVDAIADGVVFQLIQRGVEIPDDDRNGPFIPPQNMPPRGTVGLGEVTE